MNLLSVRDLDVTFQVRTRGAWPWTAPRPLQAVKGVSFDLAHGETLGIVGESGSGKSTLARAIVGTLHPTCGEVFLEGEAIGGKPPRTRGLPISQFLTGRIQLYSGLSSPFLIRRSIACVATARRV